MRVSTRMAGYYQLMLRTQAENEDAASAAQQQARQLKAKAQKAKTGGTTGASALPDSKDARLRAVAAKYDPEDMKGSDLGRVAKELRETGAISLADASKLISKAMRGAHYEKADESCKLNWIKETEAEVAALKKEGKDATASQRVLDILKLVDAARTATPINVKV